MRPSHDELKILWLNAYARAALMEADQWLDAMKHSTDQKSVESHALTCAVVVAYARPFTKAQISHSNRVIPLKDVQPPSHLRTTHDMVLKLRNTVMGHKEATLVDADSTKVNTILIRKDASGFDLHTKTAERIQPEIQKEIKSLCAYFMRHCIEKITPIINRCRNEINCLPVGEYELLITEPPDEWLRDNKPGRPAMLAGF